MYIYIYIHTYDMYWAERLSGVSGEPVHSSKDVTGWVLRMLGTGLMGTYLNGHLVLQGNIPLRTSRFKRILKLFARKRLGTRWAKYPFSRCRDTGFFAGAAVKSNIAVGPGVCSRCRCRQNAHRLCERMFRPSEIIPDWCV